MAADTADRCRSAEQSDGRRPRAKVIGLVAGTGVAGWVVTDELASTAGEHGRRRTPSVGRNRFMNDERSPPRVRTRDGVDGATDGESSELSASVLFDTLVVDIRLRDELPPPPPVSEKIDSRLGSVSGDNTPGVGDNSASYINTLTAAS